MYFGRTKTVQPATSGSALIDCVVDMTNLEERDNSNHVASHYVFLAKVLREPRQDALDIAYGFRHIKLTREKCLEVAETWHDTA
jgi:hypothetical protein